MATIPQPSKAPGWYVADEPGRHAFTSDPKQARLVCEFCLRLPHAGPEGACLL